jgi:hypothetical protein
MRIRSILRSGVYPVCALPTISTGNTQDIVFHVQEIPTGSNSDRIEFCGYCGGDYADYDLLGCGAVHFDRYTPTFRRNVLPSPSR